MGIAVFANSHQKPSCARLHKLPPLCSSGLLRSLCWCLYKSFCLFRDQRFGIAFVSHNQGLFGQGPTFRDRFCVPASGSVWAGTNVSGPLVCPSIRVCLGRDQRFGIAFVSQHQGLFGQGQTLRDRLCVLSSGSHLMTLIMGHTSGPERLVPDQKTTPGKNSKTFIQHVICGKSLQWHILRVVYWRCGTVFRFYFQW